MWCPMMAAHSWRTLLGSPRACGVKAPPINPNYAGGHRLSSLIRVIVLSARGDTSLEVLRCGEALPTVLLECTVAGMATCTLTLLTEITPAAGEQLLLLHPDDP